MQDLQDGLGNGPLRRVGTRALLLALALAAPASAAERRLSLSSFERIRVEGAFAVTLTAGRSPGGTIVGDTRALDGVEVRQDGGTVIVRGVTDQARAGPQHDDAPPLRIALATPSLASATVLGGGTLAIVGGRAQRLDLAVTGPGAITLAGADAEQLGALVIGTGAITLAGHAAKARLTLNGAGTIAADKFDVGDLSVSVDGPGEIAARARYTAAVTNRGLGHVVVAGNAKCVVRSAAGGPVKCGAER